MKKILFLAVALSLVAGGTALAKKKSEAGKETKVAQVKGKTLTEKEAARILLERAASLGAASRAVKVLWVHEADDDAVVRVQDGELLMLMKFARQQGEWALGAVESRTGEWIPVAAAGKTEKD